MDLLNSATLPYLLALIAGVLVLILPRLGNFLIALYLIIIGLVGIAPSLGINLPIHF